MRAAFWLGLRDYQPTYRTPDPEFFGHYGLLQHSFARKPPGAVFEHPARANHNR